MDILCGRLRSAEHWAAARAACRATAARTPPSDEGGAFFAEYWVGPYQLLRPEWALAALVGGRFAGYLTGCPDTPRFRRERLVRHRLPLFLGALAGRWGRPPEVGAFLRRTLALRGAADALPVHARRELETRFPAHLHMNVLPEFQGRGVGRALLARFFEELEGAGVCGAHLVCGAKAEGFYAREGFETLLRWEAPGGAALRAMVR